MLNTTTMRGGLDDGTESYVELLAKVGALQPDNLEGGREDLVMYHEILPAMLKRQIAAISPKKSRGFWRGLFGR